MTELEREIRREIADRGPIPFSRFMELALYHPVHGYYCRPRTLRDDYYTSADLQPVFGRLIARQIALWRDELGSPPEFTVVELGSGGGETARQVRACLPGSSYIEVDKNSGALPDRVVGVVFSNEFFDALAVRVFRVVAGGLEERRVAAGVKGLVWADGDPSPDLVEVNDEAVAWMERIARSLDRGFVLTIDYGYTAGEIARFPQGSLMSYRGHGAMEEVLAEPGLHDITAHVNFTALAEAGEKFGLRAAPLVTQAQFLLSLGQADEFAAALAASNEEEAGSHRLHLKTLLYGMGETFQVLIQRKP